MTNYNLTNLSSSWDVTSVIIETNSLANGAIGLMILISVFLLIFITMKNTYESRRALMAASFFTTVTSILLSIINMIGYNIVAICIILTAGIFLLLHGEEG